MPITAETLRKNKQQDDAQPFACVTAYDATFTRVLEDAGVSVLLVGDSLGTVLQGHDTTLPVHLADIEYHLSCVVRGSSGRALIMADMPFMTYPDIPQALDNAAQLMRAGAHCVKLEGGDIDMCEMVMEMTCQGIPVCGHLGLTPQAVHIIGGYKIQGKDSKVAEQIQEDAKNLQKAGAKFLVLECVPNDLARSISEALSIPVIGIGAGEGVDAQILVLHDLLGLNPKPPKFVRNFMTGAGSVAEAVENYVEAVRTGEFPSSENIY